MRTFKRFLGWTLLVLILPVAFGVVTAFNASSNHLFLVGFTIGAIIDFGILCMFGLFMLIDYLLQ